MIAKKADHSVLRHSRSSKQHIKSQHERGMIAKKADRSVLQHSRISQRHVESLCGRDTAAQKADLRSQNAELDLEVELEK